MYLEKLNGWFDDIMERFKIDHTDENALNLSSNLPF